MRICKHRIAGRPTKKWYLDFTHDGIRRKLPAFTSRQQTEALGRRVQALIDSRASGETPPGLQEYLNGLPFRMLRTFARWGLISETRAMSVKPLTAHLRDYLQVLESRGHSRDYRVRMESRCKRFLEGGRFVYFRDITLSAAELYLGRLRKTCAPTTVGHYLDAFKTFLNWAVEDGRIPQNPLARLKKPPRQTARKGVLTPEQFQRLVFYTTAYGRKRGPLRGADRGMLYYLAGCTGLRRAELLALRWDDLSLEDPPFVHVRADISKNRRSMDLPIPAGLAALLQQHRPRQADGRVFSRFGRHCRTAELIAKDLTDAGLPTADRDGNPICFHSLRNSYISFLLNRNIPIKTVQKLARHSDPRLTMNVYGRAFEDTEAAAVLSLPDPQKSLPTCLPFFTQQHRKNTDKGELTKS